MHVTEAHKNLFAGIFFALLSLFVLFVVNPHGIVQPVASHLIAGGAAAVAPDFFPNMICWLAFVCSLGLATQGAMALWRAAASKPTETPTVEADPEEKDAAKIALIARITGMILLFVMYYMTNRFGIIIAGFFFYLAYAFLTGERRPVRALLGASIITVILFYFFVRIALVPVPLGPLEDFLY
jgi:hypothetical protein